LLFFIFDPKLSVVSICEGCMRSKSIIAFVVGCFIFAGCRETETSKTSLFKLRESSHTGISFENTLDYTDELNVYTFRNFYNGGGVGLGDFNNDGLLDIFFGGNLVSNKLYLNKSKFQFEDVSVSSGIAGEGVWTTGISLVDINADGWLDIYICKSGPPGGARRNNELFVNNGNLTFTERAHEYGLDFIGLSIHAAFFDYDKDGDLDCYLLNNSIRSVGGYDLIKDQRNIPDTLGGNKLLNNDNGRFRDVSIPSGIYTSAIGFGLGVTIGDVNQDGWQDIYVSNDFFEKDYLYINQKNGVFKESLEDYMREISLGSMGADMADINNDGYPEIFVTEMLPENDHRLKTTGQFENWEKLKLNIRNGYYRQFGRNVLQLNNRDGSFSEISRLSGVDASDWSWGALIFDMDNDGLKDIFVANGIYKDLINQDYINFVADQQAVREILKSKKNGIKQLIDSIPSNKVPNYAFRNNGDLTFTNEANEWGLGTPSHSNGSAYGDLDNDGDVDLVVSNVNMPVALYENQSQTFYPERKFLTIVLKGEGQNTAAVGSKVTLKAEGQVYYQELSPMRGFMSSVDYRLHFGLGALESVDSVIVQWPDGRMTVMNSLKTNQSIQIDQRDAKGNAGSDRVEARGESATPLFSPPFQLPGVDFVHVENDFSDFDRDRLLFNMISNEGPCLCTGDFDNDGRDDFYIGGAKGQPGELYLQTRLGSFRALPTKAFIDDNESEDTDCVFFDANGDKLLDLYVTSGGYEFSSSSSALRDRLYINKGKKDVVRSDQILPAGQFESTSAVDFADIDNDGDLDLFVGVRVMPSLYGVPVNGYILRNAGKGVFENVTKEIAPDLIEVGLLTDGHWVDINHDKFPDLLVAGEWMPIKLFVNQGGDKFIDQTNQYGLESTAGWYHNIVTGDFNHDGWVDFIAGNHGMNSRFKASGAEPVRMYVNDFDENGKVEQIITHYDNGIEYPMVLRQDLVAQLPGLKRKYLHYRNYSEQTMDKIFSKEQLEKAITLTANTLETTLWINTGKSSFTKGTLPKEAQFSPVYAMLVDDFDNDGNLDVLMGGNLYRAKPETGIYDGSYGLLLKGDGKGNFSALNSRDSGVFIKGEIRGLSSVHSNGKSLVLVARNNDYPVAMKSQSKKGK